MKRIHPKGLNRAGAGVLLTSFPERFIQKVLHNVDRQHVSVDDLTPHDLDQLSRLIVDALQVVDQDQDQDQGQNRGLARVRPGPRDLGGQLTDDEEEEGGENEERRGDFLRSALYIYVYLHIRGNVVEVLPRKESNLQPVRPSAQTDEAQRGARQHGDIYECVTDVSLFVPTERKMDDQDMKVSKVKVDIWKNTGGGGEGQRSFTHQSHCW